MFELFATGVTLHKITLIGITRVPPVKIVNKNIL
jgi:hypothetical protein